MIAPESSVTRTARKQKKRRFRLKFCRPVLRRLVCIFSCFLNLISLRNCLVLSFFFIILITAIPLFLLMLISTQLVIGNVVTSMSTGDIERIRAELDAFFLPTDQASQYLYTLIQDKIKKDKMNVDDPSQFSMSANVTQELMLNALKIFNQPRSFYVGFSDGSFYGWGKAGNFGDLYKETRKDSVFFAQANNNTKTACNLPETPDHHWCTFKRVIPGQITSHDCPTDDIQPIFFQYNDKDLTTPECMTTLNPQGGFISTTRSWWKQAAQYKAFSLTDAYHWKDADLVGFSGTQPIYDTDITGAHKPDAERKMIAATCVDYELGSLSARLRDVKAGRTGWYVLLDDNLKLLASNSGSKFDDLRDSLLDATKVDDPRISDFANLAQQWIDGDVEKTFQRTPTIYGVTFHNWFLHRVVMTHQRYFSSLGVIPIIVIPVLDFSFVIVLVTLSSSSFLLIVICIALTCSCTLSLCIDIPLRKLSRMMAKIRQLKMEDLRPVWYLNLFYEFSKMQTSFFVLVDYLRQYRSFLPVELINEIENTKLDPIIDTGHTFFGNPGASGRNNGNNSGDEDFDERSDASSGSSDNKDKDNIPGPIIMSKNGSHMASGQSLGGKKKSSSSGGGPIKLRLHLFPKKPKIVDIMSLGLAFVETTMVSIKWLNCYVFFQELELREFLAVHTQILFILLKNTDGLNCVADFRENKFMVYFPNAIASTLCDVLRMVVDIRKELKEDPTINQYGPAEFIFGLSAERMATGTVGTEDIRKKIKFGQCAKLNKCCTQMCIQRNVDIVVSDRFYMYLRPVVEFRPVGFAKARKLEYDLFVFERAPTLKDEEELRRKTEEFPKSEYALGFEELLKGRYNEAITLFNQYLYHKPKDVLSKELIKKTNEIMKKPRNSDEIYEELSIVVD